MFNGAVHMRTAAVCFTSGLDQLLICILPATVCRSLACNRRKGTSSALQTHGEWQPILQMPLLRQTALVGFQSQTAR